MTHNNRRDILKGIAAASLIPTFANAQAKFRYKLGISIPDSHPTVVGFRAAAKEILALSNGALDIEVFANGSLGGDSAVISQLRAGGVEMFATTGAVWANLVPVATISSVAFAFPDYKTLWAAQDGDLGKHVRLKLSELNLAPLPMVWDNGYRNMTSANKPILTPDDLKGLKIRVPQAPMFISLFSGLGAAPTSIPFGELYSALQTKICDAQENPLALIETAKLYEVQKFCSISKHIWDGFTVCFSKRSWDALPKDLQQIITTAFDKHGVEQRKTMEALDGTLRATLTSRGMTFAEIDVKPFRDACAKAGFYTEWKGKLGAEAWGLLEKYTGPLA
jgi:TRAP-type transport system periplasmic protein